MLMRMMIGYRSDFGKDWTEVVNDQCLGKILPVSTDNACGALWLVG